MKLRCANTNKLYPVEVLEAPFARATGNRRAAVTSGQPGDYKVTFPDGDWCCPAAMIGQWGELVSDQPPAGE